MRSTLTGPHAPSPRGHCGSHCWCHPVSHPGGSADFLPEEEVGFCMGLTDHLKGWGPRGRIRAPDSGLTPWASHCNVFFPGTRRARGNQPSGVWSSGKQKVLGNIWKDHCQVKSRGVCWSPERSEGGLSEPSHTVPSAPRITSLHASHNPGRRLWRQSRFQLWDLVHPTTHSLNTSYV